MYWSHIYPVYGQFTYNWGFLALIRIYRRRRFLRVNVSKPPSRVMVYAKLFYIEFLYLWISKGRIHYTLHNSTDNNIAKTMRDWVERTPGKLLQGTHILLFLKKKKSYKGIFTADEFTSLTKSNVFDQKKISVGLHEFRIINDWISSHYHSSKSDPWATGFRANMDHLGHLWLIF